MKKVLAIALLMVASVGSATESFNAQCKAMFSPRGNIEAEVVKQIDASERTVDLLAYSYTSNPIGEAMRRAHGRGVTVREIVDRTGPTQLGGEMVKDKAAGIAVYVDVKHRIAHNKVLVVDGAWVITGSYNWSASAETVNAENVVVCQSAPMAQIYTQRFEYLLSIAERF